MRWWDRLAEWDERNRLLVDGVGALLLLLVTVGSAAGGSWDPAGTGWDRTPLIVLVTVVMTLALAWRRAHPVASAVAVYGAALVHLVIGVPVIPADALVLVALHSITVHGPVWGYRTALAGALLGSATFGTVLIAVSGGGLASGVASAVGAALTFSTVFALALVRRSRRDRLATLRDRAERLEVERDQQARIAAAGERARIAREMHDIVAHSLSVVIAQADGGRYAAAHDPAAAERALTTVAETGRAALADMRRLLGVLRTDADPEPSPVHPGGPVDLTPQPAVEDVEQLVAQVRSSGVRVSLVRMGTPRRLPPGTGLTVYRICQESLTNVLKHAGPEPTATVLLQWTPTSLLLEVVDDGRGASADDDGAGHGVLGMRERAAMLGGSLTAGPRPGGGYRVRAEIPVPPAPEAR